MGGEGYRPKPLGLLGGGFGEESDFPVAGVVSQGDGGSVRFADATVAIEDKDLRSEHLPGAPAHARILT